MHIHYVQHAAHEGPGRIVAWAADRGHDVTDTRVDRGESLPDPTAPDLLVVLGGPMSADDEDTFPWLTEELTLLDAALDADTVVLGVCLGAQLLARALGAEVGPHEHTEQGWFPVEATAAAADDPVFGALPERYVPFHWHGDSFEIPADARRTAGSEACANQAFAAEGTYGLQFHLEATPDSVRELVEESGAPAEGTYVQSADAVRDATEQLAALREHHDAFMDALVAHHGLA